MEVHLKHSNDRGDRHHALNLALVKFSHLTADVVREAKRRQRHESKGAKAKRKRREGDWKRKHPHADRA